MLEDVIKLGGKKKSIFLDKVREILPEGGNLNLCLTCGACSSGCPATGLEGMDPRKFLRMAALGLDDEILKSNIVPENLQQQTKPGLDHHSELEHLIVQWQHSNQEDSLLEQHHLAVLQNLVVVHQLF